MIFPQGDITPPVEPVFDAPMPLDNLQKSRGSGLLRGEVGDAIDRLGMPLVRSVDGALETKDLLYPWPVRGQSLIQFGAGNQFAPL